MRNFFPFTISDQVYALPLSAIDTVVRSVALIALPKAAAGVLGLLDLRGRLVPVLDIHQRLGFASQPVTVEQRIVIAHAGEHLVAFVADAVDSVLSVDEAMLVDSESLYPQLDHYVCGVFSHAGQRVLLCHPQAFLKVDNGALPVLLPVPVAAPAVLTSGPLAAADFTS